MTKDDIEKEFLTIGEAPYCMATEHYFDTCSKLDPVFDYWSVGVAILEVLVGTEFIVTIKDCNEMLGLLGDFKPYLDETLADLLAMLLGENGCKDFY